MIPNPRDLAMNMIRNNPKVANNPNAQEFINVIQIGDAAKGQQIAQNLCNTYGVTPEEAMQQAKQFFKLP